jgi:hypothetical protein
MVAEPVYQLFSAEVFLPTPIDGMKSRVVWKSLCRAIPIFQSWVEGGTGSVFGSAFPSSPFGLKNC